MDLYKTAKAAIYNRTLELKPIIGTFPGLRRAKQETIQALLDDVHDPTVAAILRLMNEEERAALSSMDLRLPEE